MSETATPEREAERYPQIVRAVRETPWAILEGTLATILDIVGRRIEGEKLTQEEIQARVGDRTAVSTTEMVGSVAVIPMAGVIIPKATLFSQMSGGTSVQQLQSDFREALADKDVQAIVFDIDSPGGMTDGIPELAAEIRAARGTKPIVAVASYRAASAAYWLGSQADEFVGSPSGDVGSIGVFAVHQDVSQMDEKLGVKTSLISAKNSPRKTQGNPHEPLTDEARSAIQNRVDEMMGMFESDVAKGRRVTVETVRSSYGQGEMLSASKALAAGLLDRIDTLETVIAKLQNPAGRARVANSGTTAEAESINITGSIPLTYLATKVTDSATDAEAATGAAPATFTDAVDEAHRAIEAVVNGAEALRALTGVKRDQLAALIERGRDLLSRSVEAAKEDEPAVDEREIEFAVAAAGSRLRRSL